MTSTSQGPSSRRVIGVAVSATTLTVPGVGVWPLTPRQPGYDQWEALRDAFAALAAQLRATQQAGVGGRLAVAILPPLTAIRSVTLPKLRETDLQAVLTRNVPKYFPSIREPHTVAAITIGAATANTFSYTVAVAPSSLLAAIEDAAAQSGWSIDRLLPAYAAWATIGTTRTNTRTNTRSAKGSAATVVIPRDDGGVDLMQVVRGMPHEVRKLRANAPERDRTAAGAVTIDRPADAAARQATSTRTLEFVTAAVRNRRNVGKRSKRTMLAIAAGVLIVAMMGGQWWRIRTQLKHVAEQRATLAPTIATARRAQATLQALMAPAHILIRIEEHGVRWSTTFMELTEHLPSDAYVSSVRATGDSLSVEAVARNGAGVFQTVSASPLLKTATPVGPIRSDLRNDPNAGEPMERFTLLARLPGATPIAPIVPTASRGHHP